MLRRRGRVDDTDFWAEVQALGEHYKGRNIEVSSDTLYLNHILTYVKAGRMKGLTNAKLKELGNELAFYDGMPQFLEDSKHSIEDDARFRVHGITVEHYIVSTGLRQVILGSAVASHVKGVWACEFIEEPAQPGFLKKAEPPSARDQEISQVGYFLDNTTKTRAIWEINKGVNVDPSIGVNDLIAESDRRVPIPNMICVADGPTDVPMFSILNTFGGKTFGVYNPNQEDHFKAVMELSDQGRVKEFAPADYRASTHTSRLLLATLERMADVIVRNRELARIEKVRPPGGHIT